MHISIYISINGGFPSSQQREKGIQMDNDPSSATLTQRIQPPSALGLEMQQQTAWTAWTAEKLESTTSGAEVCTLWITKKKHPKVKDHQNRNRSTAQPLEFRLQVIFHALALPALPALPAATRRRRAGLRINCTSTGLGSCGAVLQHVLSTPWTGCGPGS